MGRSLFDPEAPLWHGVGIFTDLLLLSLAWLFLSLAVVPMGAATAGLYDAVSRCVLGGRSGTMRRFWNTFRREFRTASLVTVLWGGACLLMGGCVWLLRARVVFAGTAAVFILALWFAVLLVPVGALCWMFPLLSRFPFSAGKLIAAGIRFSLGYFPRTALVVGAAVGAVMLSLWLLVPMLILPGLTAMLWARAMEGVFARYS